MRERTPRLSKIKISKGITIFRPTPQMDMEGSEKTYYEMLGVERDASIEQIKEAYREIARVLHPDSNFYSEIVDYEVSNNQLDLFKMVTAAYHTLVSKDKREAYDRTLPPELRGWIDQDDDQAAIDAKLVELGLKDPAELPPKPSPKIHAAAFGKFGAMPQVEPDSSEHVAPQIPTSKKASVATPQSTFGVGLSRAATMSRAHQKAAPASSRSSWSISPTVLYVIIGGASFVIGTALMLLVLL